MRLDPGVVTRHSLVGQLDVAVAAATDKKSPVSQFDLYEQLVVGVEIQSWHQLSPSSSGPPSGHLWCQSPPGAEMLPLF